MPDADEKARRKRAEELRRAIDEAGAGARPGRPPASPREFTDEKAREAAEEERRRAEHEEREG
jgi:hypothetical protein